MTIIRRKASKWGRLNAWPGEDQAMEDFQAIRFELRSFAVLARELVPVVGSASLVDLVTARVRHRGIESALGRQPLKWYGSAGFGQDELGDDEILPGHAATSSPSTASRAQGPDPQGERSTSPSVKTVPAGRWSAGHSQCRVRKCGHEW